MTVKQSRQEEIEEARGGMMLIFYLIGICAFLGCGVLLYVLFRLLGWVG